MRHRYKFLSSGITILLLVSASSASGQGLTWMGIELWKTIDSARSRLGSIRMNNALRISNAGYDSNIYPGLQEEPVEDATAFAGPELHFYVPVSRKLILELFESPSYAFYARTKKERSWNNIFRGEANFVFERLLFRLGGGHSNIRQPVSTEVDLRFRLKSTNLLGAILWQTGRWTSLLAEFQWAELSYDDSGYFDPTVRERLNRHENRLKITAFSQRGLRSRLRLDGEYISYVFTQTPGVRDCRSYSVHGGIDFLEESRVRGAINLGYIYFDPVNPLDKSFSGIIGNTRLSLRVTRALEIIGFFERDMEFSVWLDNLYYVQTMYGPGTTIYLSRNVALGYELSIGQNSYALSSSEGGTPNRIDDHVRHSFRFDFRFGTRFQFTLLASHWVRDSTLESIIDTRDFAGFTLIYFF